MFNIKIKLILCLSLLFVLSINNYVFSKSNIFPDNSAEGAILIDVETGRILYEKKPDKQLGIASLTKIMTAIIALENGDLKEMVKTSSNAFGVEGSSIYLKNGEELTLEDMLYGLMLRSGNDAAVAIAEHIGGSIEGFAYLMNEKAIYLGMSNSHFMNPHGLDHPDHYSTPKDMAILTAYALKNPTFKEIVSTKVKTAPVQGENWNRKWYNKNKLLSLYQWADGVKTGYTKLAKRCLASSATKNNFQLAAITLNAPNDWNDHIRLFEFGFENYQHITIVEKGEIIAETNEGLTIIAESSFSYPLKELEKNLINKEIYINEDAKTKYVGKIKIYLNEKYIGSVSLKIKENETFGRKVINVLK